MTEVIDNRKGSLSLLEFSTPAKSLQNLNLNFAVLDVEGKILYLYQNEKTNTDIKHLQKAVKPVIQKCIKEKASDVMFIQSRYIASWLITNNTIQTAREGCCLVVIDLGKEKRHDDVVKAVTQTIEMIVHNFQIQVQANKQIEMVSSELSKIYEELVLLHKVSTNMRVTESDFNYLQIACDSLTDLVPVEGIAVLVERVIEQEKKMIISAGSGLINIDSHLAETIASRLQEETNLGKEALLDSEVLTPFKYSWPNTIKNIIAVPLFGKENSHSAAINKMIGYMVAVNRIDKEDFDSIDAKLFNSVANSCAVFIENGNLFNDLKDLFIGSLKALTSSIDAKDPYTRGHSERVAFISKWIAEILAKNDKLDRNQVHQVYLAGLLHDIGKMGVDENVLKKDGKLTSDEYNQIKEHPSIGGAILAGIKQMKDIVPGVLSHHERVDGTGYPNAVTGQKIPLIARIISIADSFDAMTSKRTYREAMTVDQALAEMEKGLGTQFDEEIGRLFLDSDIYYLWDMLQDGLKDVYNTYDFSNYGTVAIGTLLR